MDVLTAARDYTDRGFFCVPIPHGEKGPRRKGWNELRLTTEQIGSEFMPNNNVGVILGEASGWLTDVDLDCEEAVRLADQYLPPTGMVTGRDGRPRSHWWYVCENAETVRLNEQSTGDTIVELRSSGLQTVVGPSVHPDGGQYELLNGEPARVPYPTLRACVDALHAAVLKERGNDAANANGTTQPAAATVSDRVRRDPVCGSDAIRPGDDYNERGDLHSLLVQHGWRVAGQGTDGNIQLTRPGKTHGISATYKNGVFFLFSSSVTGFEPDRGYSPFEVYTRYEHNGDHSAAAAELARQGYGETPDYDVDLSGLSVGTSGNSSVGAGRGHAGHPDCERGALNERDRSDSPQVADDGLDGTDAGIHGASGAGYPDRETQTAMPEHLLRVPGFLAEHLDYTLSVAHAQQPVLTLFAGICLQAALAGRKITDPYGNQTCLYVAALSESGSGKDKPRAVNSEILASVGSKLCGPEDIASDAGLNTLLAEQPASLLQIDEFGRFLKAIAIGGERATHLFKINTAFLRLYSSIGRMYRPTAYGDSARNAEINHPCPVIYGSTVPESFWGAMTSESMTDGLLARLIPITGESKPKRCIAKSKPLPRSLLNHARDWDRRTNGDGNMTSTNPSPEVIEYTPDAEQFAIDYAMRNNDLVDSGSEWRGLYARSFEKAARLALVYAASRSVESPQIDLEAIQWATEVIDWSNSLFVTIGSLNIADSQHERNCQRAYQAIKQRGQITHSQLMRHRCFRSLPRRDREEIITTLSEADRIAVSVGERGGRTYFAS